MVLKNVNALVMHTQDCECSWHYGASCVINFPKTKCMWSNKWQCGWMLLWTIPFSCTQAEYFILRTYQLTGELWYQHIIASSKRGFILLLLLPGAWVRVEKEQLLRYRKLRLWYPGAHRSGHQVRPQHRHLRTGLLRGKWSTDVFNYS